MEQNEIWQKFDTCYLNSTTPITLYQEICRLNYFMYSAIVYSDKFSLYVAQHALYFCFISNSFVCFGPKKGIGILLPGS